MNWSWLALWCCWARGQLILPTQAGHEDEEVDVIQGAALAASTTESSLPAPRPPCPFDPTNFIVYLE